MAGLAALRRARQMTARLSSTDRRRRLSRAWAANGTGSPRRDFGEHLVRHMSRSRLSGRLQLDAAGYRAWAHAQNDDAGGGVAQGAFVDLSELATGTSAGCCACRRSERAAPKPVWRRQVLRRQPPRPPLRQPGRAPGQRGASSSNYRQRGEGVLQGHGWRWPLQQQCWALRRAVLRQAIRNNSVGWRRAGGEAVAGGGRGGIAIIKYRFSRDWRQN